MGLRAWLKNGKYAVGYVGQSRAPTYFEDLAEACQEAKWRAELGAHNGWVETWVVTQNGEVLESFTYPPRIYTIERRIRGEWEEVARYASWDKAVRAYNFKTTAPKQIMVRGQRIHAQLSENGFIFEG